MKTFFRKLFTFKGLVGRKYFALYWFGYVVFMLVLLPFAMRATENFEASLGYTGISVFSGLILVLLLAILWSSLSVIVRRMRAAGFFTGFSWLLIFVPIVNAFVAISLFFIESKTPEELAAMKPQRDGSLTADDPRSGYTSAQELNQEANNEENRR